MPQARNLEGTDALKFQLGIGGPQEKANGGNIETRNAGDTAFAIHRAADPVGADDLVTKRYVDALTNESNVFVVDPAAPQAGRVFNAWTAGGGLDAALLACQGPRVVYFRNLAPTLGIGAHAIGPDPLKLIGPGDEDATLTIVDGATFTGGLVDFATENIDVTYQGTTGPALTIGADGQLQQQMSSWRSTGGRAMIRVNGGGWVDWIPELAGTAGGATVLEATGGGNIELQSGNMAHVGANTLSDVGATGFVFGNINSASSGNVSNAQAACAGGVGGFLYSGATNFLKGPGGGAPAIQAGVVTLGAGGVSAAIAATITATSRIVAFPKAVGAPAAPTQFYAALTADRVVGAPGSFKISAMAGGAVNPGDAATLDWIVIN